MQVQRAGQCLVTLRLGTDSCCVRFFRPSQTRKVSKYSSSTTGSSSSVSSCCSTADFSSARQRDHGRGDFRRCRVNVCVTSLNNPPPPTVLQRSEIVKAAYEPTDEECKWTADEEEELTVSKQVLVTYTPACPPSRFALESLHALCTQPVEPSEPDRHTLPQLNRK